MTMSRPASLWCCAWSGRPHSAATRRPAPCTSRTTSSGGVPSALATSRTLSWRSAISTCGVAVASVHPRSCPVAALALGQLGDAVLGEHVLGELDVPRGTSARRCSASLSGSVSPMPSYLPGMTTSTPYGASPTCSSIQSSSIPSCSGEKPTAPSTPKPPALLTAATTSRQWVKAKIGYSIPSWSHSGVRMAPSQDASLDPHTASARCSARYVHRGRSPPCGDGEGRINGGRTRPSCGSRPWC